MICMSLRMFRSASAPDIIAYSRDESGQNLPVDVGPWILQSERPMLTGGSSTDPTMAEIAEQGYALIGARKPE